MFGIHGDPHFTSTSSFFFFLSNYNWFEFQKKKEIVTNWGRARK